jgi:hypothetical protein
MKRRRFLQSFLASAIFIAATATALPAELKGDQQKVNTCLIINPSQQMEALARQIAKAAIVNQPWSALEQEFNLEVRRVAHEQCGISTEQIASSDFGAVTEHQLEFRFYMAINDALGGRAISPKVRPTFDSGTVARCLFNYSRLLHKSLVVATVYEKLSGDRNEPGYKALSADLKAMAQRHCALKPKQVSGPQFRVTIADYIYDGSFALLMPLLSSPR